MKHLSIWNMGTSKPWGRRLFSSKEMHALVGYVAQLEAELEQRRTQIAHLQPVYLEVCEENEALRELCKHYIGDHYDTLLTGEEQPQ